MNSTAERLNAMIEKIKDIRIAVLGDLMLDRYVSGTASRLSQEAPVPVLHVRKSEVRLGGAANVMRNLTSLGVQHVLAFGVVGQDRDGEELCALLQKGGVHTDGVLAVPDRRTTVKQRVIASSQQVVRMDFEDTEPVSEEVRNALVEQICSRMKAREIDALILEDYAKGLLERDMLQVIADTAREYGVYTSLDPHPGHDMKVRGLSLMTPNRAEAFDLAEHYWTEPEDVVEEDRVLRKVAMKVMENWIPDSLLVTLSHQENIRFFSADALLGCKKSLHIIFERFHSKYFL